MSGQDIARRLDWTPTKVSRLERGYRGVSEIELVMYLAMCRVPREALDEILELAREVDEGYRVKPLGERLPDELRTLIFHETSATEIENFEPIFIPGLLQIEDYIRELLFEGGMIPAPDIETQVQARMRRQELLRRPDPPRFRFFIHENALRLPVGNARVMHEQMLHLVFLTSRPQCVIRVLPVSNGARGMVNVAFMRLGYAEHDPAAWVDTPAASLFIDRSGDVAFYRRILNQLDQVALDEGQSRSFLAELASEYDRMEDGPR